MEDHYKLRYLNLNKKRKKSPPHPPFKFGFPCYRPGKGFVPNFPMFAKTDVNGKDQNPIYTFLKVKTKHIGLY